MALPHHNSTLYSIFPVPSVRACVRFLALLVVMLPWARGQEALAESGASQQVETASGEGAAASSGAQLPVQSTDGMPELSSENSSEQQAVVTAPAKRENPTTTAPVKAPNIDLKQVAPPPVVLSESAPLAENEDTSADEQSQQAVESQSPKKTAKSSPTLPAESALTSRNETADLTARESEHQTPSESEGSEQRDPHGAITHSVPAAPAPSVSASSALPHDLPAGAPSAPELKVQPAAQAGESEVPVEAKVAEPFVLLGAEVAPATSTRLGWTPRIAIAGLASPVPVLVINGAEPGPTLCLTAAIHGDELNGIEVVRRVVYDIEPDKLSGRVIGIPIVNLQGFQRNSRYLADRRDLNRFFPGSPGGSIAARIANSLFHEVIRHCDALIDLHTGSQRRTNLPQLRADMEDDAIREFTENFDDIVVVHSPGKPGMLRKAAAEIGIPAVTLEIGESNRLQKEQVESGVKSVNGLLDRMAMYERLLIWGDPEPIYYQSTWVRADSGGILFSLVELGAFVKAGDLLGRVTDPITNAVGEIKAPFDGRVIGMAVNQVVMPGFATYHLGIRSSELEVTFAAKRKEKEQDDDDELEP